MIVEGAGGWHAPISDAAGMQELALAINIGLNLWLIPTHGWRGAAWSSLVTDGLLGAMNWSALQLLVSRAQEVRLSSTLNA